MSITPQNGMVAITQSTELFAQVPVDDEQIVSNPAPRTLPRNPTPQKQREHHLSSSSGSRSSSSETDEKSVYFFFAETSATMFLPKRPESL